MATDHVGVSIITAKRHDQLARCLESLIQGSRIPDEIVILNNAPEDSLSDLFDFSHFKTSIRIIETDHLGFAEARNRCLSEVEADKILVLDDDCIASPEWVETLAKALDDFDAVGGSVNCWNQHPQPRDWDPGLNWSVGLSSPFDPADPSGAYQFPNTSNIGFRKAVWQEIKFQELGGELKVNHSNNYAIGREDAQWWRDVRDAGFATQVIPDAVVFHDIPAKRYQVGISTQRAQWDGRSDWNRSKDKQKLSQAASDVVGAPFNILRDTVRKHRDFRTARRLHGTWAKRQAAFLDEAVNDYSSDFSPTDRTKLFLRESAKQMKGRVKAATRRALNVLYHRIKKDEFAPLDSGYPHRICLVCYPNVGDALLLLPLVNQIIESRPLWQVSLVVSSLVAPIFKANCPKKLQIIAHDRKPSLQKQYDLFKTIGALSPDLVVYFYYHEVMAWPIFASHRAPVISWDTNEGFYKKFWQGCLAAEFPKDFSASEQRTMRQLLNQLGLNLKREIPKISVSKKAHERVEGVLSEKKLEARRFIIILLDGRDDSFKFWPLEHVKSYAQSLLDQTDYDLVFEGTRNGRHLFEKLELSSDRVHSVHGFFDLQELAALISKARLIVGIDSGPMHIAQAVATPSLRLFGATDDFRWGPVDAKGQHHLHRTIRAERAPFSWTLDEARRFSENEHLRRLKPEPVLAETLELLASSEDHVAINTLMG